MAKLTPMQSAYKKEMQRLQRAIRREYKKTGIELDKDLIPEMPKRVTQKQLQKIKSIKPKDLRKETKFVDYESGKPLTYEEALEKIKINQRVDTPNKIFFIKNTISGYFNSIEKWNNTFQSIMHNWIDKLIQQHGEEEVAIMLWTGISEGLIVTKEIVYEEDKRQAYMSDMMSYLGMPKEIRAEILGEMEQEIGFSIPD